MGERVVRVGPGPKSVLAKFERKDVGVFYALLSKEEIEKLEEELSSFLGEPFCEDESPIFVIKKPEYFKLSTVEDEDEGLYHTYLEYAAECPVCGDIVEISVFDVHLELHAKNADHDIVYYARVLEGIY